MGVQKTHINQIFQCRFHFFPFIQKWLIILSSAATYRCYRQSYEISPGGLNDTSRVNKSLYEVTYYKFSFQLTLKNLTNCTTHEDLILSFVTS